MVAVRMEGGMRTTNRSIGGQHQITQIGVATDYILRLIAEQMEAVV